MIELKNYFISTGYFLNNSELDSYLLIIEKALIDNRFKGKDVYYEKHHIIPVCVGGTNAKSNLVLLTAKEHIESHNLLRLCSIGPAQQKLNHAYMCITNFLPLRSDIDLDIEALAESRKQYAKMRSEIMKAGNHPLKSQLSRDKLSASKKGKCNLTPESIKSIKEKLTGRKLSLEMREKISKSQKGKITSEETKQRISLAKTGVKKPLGSITNSHKRKSYEVTYPDGSKQSFLGIRSIAETFNTKISYIKGLAYSQQIRSCGILKGYKISLIEI